MGFIRPVRLLCAAREDRSSRGAESFDQRSGKQAGAVENRRRGAEAAEAAVAPLVFEDGLEEFGAAEVRPQGVGDVKFGVGDLPEEEVADAHFAGGADEEVGVGQAGGIKARGERLFVQLERIEGAGVPRFGNERVHRVNQFGAAAVIDGEVEAHAAILGGGCDRGVKFPARGRRQGVQTAHRPKLDIVLHQVWNFAAEVNPQRAGASSFRLRTHRG